jgi:FlaA1/EpsC-like NDP-sugar epimerase
MALQQGVGSSKTSSTDLKAIASRYSDFSHPLRLHARDDKQDTVVLTGATGALGAHILAQLLAKPNHPRVICLCRAGDDSDARRRVKESLHRRRLPFLENSTVVCLAAEFTQDQLGLSMQNFQEVASAATFIHVSEVLILALY